ncbi:peptidase U62 modulator of DNA gyrase [Clostridium sp. DL-VIII]|uniref:TldD/PmbA family protein n=1 Tax=Clostridium sp. DL-VIII TaxID=641107 RepID=UPI00023B005D|nr:TldD/PmbA family protein [Clostridium sp. DL-VIII]EHI99806.1 peptidase U62 modulator of DNA gyrase [Clostridium sp. DL-VIII]
MKVSNSKFLVSSKPVISKLITMLSKNYKYVSVLGTDTKGKSFRVSKAGIDVNDSMLVERGFVIRIHNGINYSEYSFNELSEEKLDSIVTNINNKLNKASEDISINSYEIIEEDEIRDNLLGEVKINPEEIGSDVIIKSLVEIKDDALAYSDLIVNVDVIYNTYHISKLFMSNKKELEQSYMLGEGYIFSVARREEKTKYCYKSFSGLKGFEIIDELKEKYRSIVEQSIKLLDAKTVEPGEYDVICAPDVSGLIAHEAFGHGVEMDMFVKNRAKGAEYIGKQVASASTTMHDGAAAAKHMSSYLFDDEGTIGTNTVIIENGILKNGISDLLSAIKLGTIPTGNGKRQSFERKAYARMTNTFFEAGNDKVEDMIASIKYGYLLEGVFSGMEDPKNWGIQCIVLLGREIEDGKLTGKLISPVVITGFVPDLLKSISMVSEEVQLDGAGYCGKGYKEFVKTSSGGPYIKAKVRLG